LDSADPRWASESLDAPPIADSRGPTGEGRVASAGPRAVRGSVSGGSTPGVSTSGGSMLRPVLLWVGTWVVPPLSLITLALCSYSAFLLPVGVPVQVRGVPSSPPREAPAPARCAPNAAG
jgi:hypothetical protein